jgi:cell fate (sporulation/competence/biofilm development) regulator YlbF (YheA/YmcA/DUF963 family)
MTIEEAVEHAQSEINYAKKLARDCYTVTDIEVEVLERAAKKLKDNEQIYNYLNSLLAISTIIKSQIDPTLAYNKIKEIIDSLE